MKLLMIIPKYSKYNMIDKPFYKYNFPMGLAYILATVKKAGYDIDCFNINHLGGMPAYIINSALSSKDYDIVLTGGIAIHYSVLDTISQTVRNHLSKPTLIIGGLIITTEPELMFDELKPDYAVIGEGEETILELLKCIENSGNLSRVNGIMYRDKDSTIKTSPREPVKDLNLLPFPDFDNLGYEKQLEHMSTNDDGMNFFDNPRAYPIMASRSCPYKCTFCYHWGNYRQRSMDNIKTELSLMIKKYKINLISIYDDLFSLEKDRLYSFCELIKELSHEMGYQIKWGCQLRVESVNKETLGIMKNAGCLAISYGFESYSPIVLKSMKKHISPEQIDKVFKETLEMGIAVQGNFIFGDPAETKDTALTTLNYWKGQCDGQINLTFVMPYPGSEIYQYCLNKGIIKDKLNFIKNEMQYPGHIIYNMTSMTDKEFKWLKREIFESEGKYGKLITPMSIAKTREGIYDIIVKCPYCRKVIEYKNCNINNPNTYGFSLRCRNCYKKFFVLSYCQKIFRKYFSFLRNYITYYLRFRDFFKLKSLP